ncbi:hypothetical protein [Psychroserpens mesophilus]|uniref:hypothetical protein n=1 Tax=Psychroserpens mesophilus TaxID=325473 RepID=UPI003F491CE8
MKNLYLLAFALFTVFSYGQNFQNIKFQPNVNHKARNLKQGLNSSGDSLILESSKHNISQVDIFNEDFLESVDVNSDKTKIDLNMLPAGNFIVQARVGKKRIIMYVQKRESAIVAYSQRNKETQNTGLESPEPLPNKNKKKSRKVIYYWAVQKTNSNFGSTKSMKLVYKDEIPELIEKNRLELQSDIGKDNTLVIYAIYDKNKFMNKQFRNPKYYSTVKRSKYFNIVPYYSSFNEVEILPNS